MVSPALAAKALAAFCVLAYAVFLVTHVPQAQQINDRWTLRDTEVLRLTDPKPAELAAMNLRGSGLASVSAEAGSKLVEPGPGTLRLLAEGATDFQPRAEGDRVDVRLQNGDASLAYVTVATQPTGAEEPVVEIRPAVRQDDTGITLKAANATLLVDAEWTSRPPWEQSEGAFLHGEQGQLAVDRVVISVPPGKRVYIGGTAASQVRFAFGRQTDNLSPDPLSADGLDLKALEILGGDGGPTRSLACGARKYDALRWPGLFGGVAASNCSNALHFSGFTLAEKSEFALAGPAFAIEDGTAHYWPLLPNLTSNLVIQGAITALSGLFIGWVFIRLGLKKDDKAKAKQPARKRRSGKRTARTGEASASVETRNPPDPT